MSLLLRRALAFCFVLAPAVVKAADIAIVGAKIYPAPDAVAIPDGVVLVHGNRVLAVGPRAGMKIPKGFAVLRATGEVVAAGFWNCHVHLISSGLLHPASLSNTVLTATLQNMFTRWGFTTVFDLASTMASANAIRSRIENGAVEGPTILTVGEPFYPPHGTPWYAQPIYNAAHLPSAEITSKSGAVARVVSEVAEGADGIKLFTGAIVGGKQGMLYMSAETIRAITSQAHRLGLQTFAHPTDVIGAELAVDNGVDILAHTDPIGGPWPTAFIEKLRAKNVGLIPTLTLFQANPDPRTPVETAIQQLKAQSQSGGDVLFGTDAGFTPVYDPTKEYRLMGQALNWRQILASLTVTPAHRFGRGDHTGKVQPGFAADLIVLNGDPARDVSNFAHVQTVIRHGELIYSAVAPAIPKLTAPPNPPPR